MPVESSGRDVAPTNRITKYEPDVLGNGVAFPL
jgi:hypothetical protein